MALGNLVVKMLTDIKDMKNKLDQYGKKIDEAKTATEKFASGVKNSFKTFIKYAAILGGAFLAVRKLTNFLKSSLDAYARQEEAITKLNAALIATGRYTPQVSEEMQKYASEMQRLTKFSDDQIESAQGIMATFTKIGTETFPEALEAAMNMSAMFGQDLQQSVIQLGTALNDPILGVGRLRRIGISFTEEQKELIKTLVEQNDLYGAQRVILDELQVEIGGTARAVGKTYAGRVAQLNAAFTDLKETMGSIMAEQINPMLPLITKMVVNLDEWIKRKKELKGAYEKLEKPMEISNEQMRLEILQAEQIIAIEQQNRLEKALTAQKRGEFTASISAGVNALQNEGETLQKTYDRLRKETRARAHTIEALKAGIKARKEHKDSVQDEIDTTDDSIKSLEEKTWAWEENIDLYDEEKDKATRAAIIYQGLIDLYDNMTNSINKTSEAVKGFLQNYMTGIVEAQSVTNEYIMTFEEFSNAFDEWAAEAEEKVNKVTSFTSLGVSAIDNVYSQMFTNRRIELDNWAYSENEALNNWYNERLQAIENMNLTDEERARLLENLETERTVKERSLNEAVEKQRRKIARDEAKANKQIAIINAIMNTAQAVVKAWAQGGFFFGGLMSAFVAAMGLRQIALIKAQPLPALAEGGEFMTNGPQYVLVGDNPGGRELVQATPLSSPNINGPAREITLNNNVYLDGDQILCFISKATEDGRLPIHKNAIRDW
jgi:hypothetical protein